MRSRITIAHLSQTTSRPLVLATGVLMCVLLFASTCPAQTAIEPIKRSSSYGSLAPAEARLPRAAKIVRLRTMPSPKAQGQLQAYKTSGTDFFVAFPSALGSDIPSDLPYKRLYISSRAQVHGTVRLIGGSWQQSFVTDPTKTISITLPVWAGLDRSETEQIYKRVFEVTAEDEIAVYAISHHHLSTDGFLVLPAETLGLNYAVASCRNSLYYFGGRARPLNAFTFDTVPRSQLLVVATQDNTTVQITPSADSYTGRFIQHRSYSFTMNRGEVMQVCAHDTAAKATINGTLCWSGKLPNADCDLTGTLLSADKPIAVFSGNERASIPDSLEFNYANHPTVSRDHIIDQMPPIESWGKTFAFIPSASGSTRSRPAAGDAVRLIAATDNTVVSFNGVVVTTLSRGAFTQFTLNKPTLITSSEPLLAVKYLQTANVPDTLGDPDMTVLPPIENMSLFYTLPTFSSNGSFSEHYVALLCDSLALTTTTLNGFSLDQTKLRPFPGTRYYYAVLPVNPGTQRIESTLPCYAEAYGYGNLDSYTFSGGGSFPYISALRAIDLDFGVVPLASSRDSNTHVIAADVPIPFSQKPEVFQYSWETGDTSVFAVLDTIRSATAIEPGTRLPVYFRFKPATPGTFHAVLRVWSNNHSPVLINVTGTAAAGSTLEVDPLDFGRVRIGDTTTGTYTIRVVGDSNVFITNPNPPLVGSPTLFHLQQIDNGSKTIPPNLIVAHIPGFVTATARYSPLAHRFDTSDAPIHSTALNTPHAVFMGRGVDYDIRSTAIDFGKVRVRSSSDWNSLAYLDSNWQDRTITNFGDDSVSIDSIVFAGGDIRDFEIDYTSNKSNNPPPQSTRWLLDTLGSVGNVNAYRVRFTPIYDKVSGILDTGLRSAVIKITTWDDRANRRIRYDTVYGRGVEPYLVTKRQVIDFGTIVNPTVNSISGYDTIVNIGTYFGIIDSLRHADGATFTISGVGAPVTDSSPVGDGASIALQIDFSVKQLGEFFDTVWVHNDSRNQPLIYIHGKVKAGLDTIAPISFGTLTDCDPIDTVVRLKNSSRSSLVIDQLYVQGDTGGFSFPDTVFLPILIDADSTFNLHVRYQFPDDSLNGDQHAYIVVRRTTDQGTLSFEYDTILFSLTRKAALLSLVTAPPAFDPSAGDAPFRLPIFLKGQRLGINGLDMDTLKIRFTNALVEPIGVDRAGSLTEEGPTGVKTQPIPIWDAATRTYLVPLDSVHFSSDASTNDLVLTVLCKTFLTTDTNVTAQAWFSFTSRPCAFRVAPVEQSIKYANECGNRTIRDLLRLGSDMVLSISSPHPNPVDARNSGAVEIGYEASSDCQLSWQLIDEKGDIVYSPPTTPARKGSGSLKIPSRAWRSSGSYVLRVQASDPSGQVQKIVTSKISVIR